MDRGQLLDAIDTLLGNDSDLVGAQELRRLDLARELMGLEIDPDQHPAITDFVRRVSEQVTERTTDLASPCTGGGTHVWELWQSGHGRRWPTVTFAPEGPWDGVEATATGRADYTKTGDGLALLRCTRPDCQTERYVPFDWDLGWDEES